MKIKYWNVFENFMRADKFFADQFGSRTKSKEALEKGLVLRNGKPLSPKDTVTDADTYVFLTSQEEFVSAGGKKLARGLETFDVPVKDAVFADLGASTGGFTDCLLQYGAKRVYCVDVGENQLAAKIVNDERVVVMDHTNARYLSKEDFPEPVNIVSDLSFISLKLVLPAVCQILSDDGHAVVLFKPQFECGGTGLGKSGILPVRFHGELLADFYDFCTALELAPQNLVPAPIREKKNIEYVVHLIKGGQPILKWKFMQKINEIHENMQ